MQWMIMRRKLRAGLEEMEKKEKNKTGPEVRTTNTNVSFWQLKSLHNWFLLVIGMGGYHESRSSRYTYPESYITKYTSLRRRWAVQFLKNGGGKTGLWCDLDIDLP